MTAPTATHWRKGVLAGVHRVTVGSLGSFIARRCALQARRACVSDHTSNAIALVRKCRAQCFKRCVFRSEFEQGQHFLDVKETHP